MLRWNPGKLLFEQSLPDVITLPRVKVEGFPIFKPAINSGETDFQPSLEQYPGRVAVEGGQFIGREMLKLWLRIIERRVQERRASGLDVASRLAGAAIFC